LAANDAAAMDHRRQLTETGAGAGGFGGVVILDDSLYIGLHL